MKIWKKILLMIFLIIYIISPICIADDFSYNDEYETLNISEVNTTSLEEPIVNSKHAIVIERKTLSVLYEKSGFEETPMASTTKIMTCILALEKCDLSKIVTVSKAASSVHGSTLGLKENMQISVNDLLYGLMLRSGNDCAIAIAEEISDSLENFAVLMNNKAKELNLKNTNFVTPHGLDDPNHYTTAYDLAILTDYALKNETFKNIVSCKSYSFNFNGYPKTINNTNELLGNLSGVYGVKTGFTFDAGRCLVSACQRNDLDIIVVVLGADTKKIRTQDSYNLINYTNSNFQYVNVSKTIEENFSNFQSYIRDSIVLEKTTDIPKFKLEVLDNYEFPLKTNGHVKLNTKIYTIKNFSSDFTMGEQVGTLYLYNNNDLICESKILLDNELKRNSWMFYFKNFFEIFK